MSLRSLPRCIGCSWLAYVVRLRRRPRFIAFSGWRNILRCAFDIDEFVVRRAAAACFFMPFNYSQAAGSKPDDFLVRTDECRRELEKCISSEEPESVGSSWNSISHLLAFSAAWKLPQKWPATGSSQMRLPEVPAPPLMAAQIRFNYLRYTDYHGSRKSTRPPASVQEHMGTWKPVLVYQSLNLYALFADSHFRNRRR